MFSKLVRNTVLVTTLAFPIVPLASQNALANDNRDFLVYNNNELEITQLYVSSAKSRYWGNNILNSDIVNGSFDMITFGNSSNQCTYDVKAIYSDGTYDLMRQANLCSTYGITFYGHGGDYQEY
ncbi:hypothetical protein [Nostoc sp. ATCC 53789]|uniref:hypothetical protein n=1 Tax=Nostoc sp. ATCC 53789 TaxID=76335 RepID=UPI000DED27C9|nr:hypothetical protein [Nostoc sp. ATCC 53789]QHG15333.1 hypothetical protein GJB62_04700 [Nostoc sp. ATCC 53789]RCJ32822.1 hypothetical protein A6V25_12045 [Nostoc sp. ATCC 53789]